MNDENLGWTEEMSGPITKATEDGVIEGIKTFFRKHNLKTEPGSVSALPLREFVLRLTAEMQDGDDNRLYKRVYPFKNSFRDPWQAVVIERSPILKSLWENKEQREAIALARTLSYLETFKFLEENSMEVIAEYQVLRGGDLRSDQESPEKPSNG